MNVIQLIVAELRTIIAKPHNIVVMLAVMCVPLLYAGMFLYSFWDAFGKTGNLPVAVVNQDQGAKIAGKTLNAGNSLVNGLKHNRDFKWYFVSSRQAEKGFEQNHYFMIVRIPASFSRDATTLSKQQVKPANLIYRNNADYNFIASRMTDAGLTSLKTRISNQITKVYAETMYDQLDKLTSGLNDAAKGSKKLTAGGEKELDGLNQLEKGFKALTAGTGKLQSGAGQLADGASRLNGGAAQLAGGSARLSNGAGKLAAGNSQLSSGADQLSKGTSTLSKGATVLNNGAGQLNKGISQYTNAVGNQLLPGASKLSSGLTQLNGGIQSQNLVGQVNELNSGMQQFASSISELQAKLLASIDPAAIGKQAVSSAMSDGLSQKSAASASQISKNVTNSIGQSINSSETQSTVSTGIEKNQELKTKLEPLFIAMVEKEQPGITDSEAKPYADALMAKQLPALANTIAQQTTKAISGNVMSNSTVSSISSTLQPSLQQSAQNTINDTATATATQIRNGISTGLSQKDPTTGLTLSSAAQQLATGTQQLAGSNGIPLIASSVNQLSGGAGQLANGLNTLDGNSAALNGGASSLAGGAQSLADGAGRLTNGASTLAGGASSLASGASSLNSGAQSLTNGANTLSSGAGTLSSGANALGSGLNSIASGQNQLASGTDQAANGAQKIYNGNKDLSGSLAQAHSELKKTPTNQAHADQFAKPVISSDQSHQTVDTFGSGFAPYFISLGLYVGALLLTIIYELYRPMGEPTSGWSIALSKFFITLLMSVGQSLLIDVIALKGLGLHVSSVPVFIGFTILTSMSFMAIIQWLAGSFDNEGRFMAVVILIMQLVSSGGAYAIELIPKWLQAVSHILPMTYSVNGFRNIIDGHQPGLFVYNTAILWLFVFIGLALSIVTFTIKFRMGLKKYEQLNDQTTIES